MYVSSSLFFVVLKCLKSLYQHVFILFIDYQNVFQNIRTLFLKIGLVQRYIWNVIHTVYGRMLTADKRQETMQIRRKTFCLINMQKYGK